MPFVDVNCAAIPDALLEISNEIASFAWTDSDVPSLHRGFSIEMSREMRMLAGLDPFATQAARVVSA
jgi:hypothetical protein